MARHAKRQPLVKGSTIIICFMYITWIAYLALQIWVYQETCTFLPSEVTLGTAALFIVETVSLARLKMTKEGTNVGVKKSNPFIESLGFYGKSEFEDEIERIQNEQSSNSNDCPNDPR
jgi:hypothetical protein